MTVSDCTDCMPACLNEPSDIGFRTFRCLELAFITLLANCPSRNPPAIFFDESVRTVLAWGSRAKVARKPLMVFNLSPFPGHTR